MRAWVNGRLLDRPDELALSAFDHGVTVGDGVFETVLVTAGQPFALRRHLRRLQRSARGLGLEPPEEAQVRSAVEAVLSGPGHAPEEVLRITVTAGPGPMGSARGDVQPTLIVASADAPRWPRTTAIASVPWPRNERGVLAGLKTTSYAENVVALAYAKQRSAGEAVFANTAGTLCEGTGSNICYVLDGELLTPSLASGCLAGITRELVLEWCGMVERDAPLDVLDEAEEIFLVSTTRGVHPVSRWNGRELVAPGPVTARVADGFASRCLADNDP